MSKFARWVSGTSKFSYFFVFFFSFRRFSPLARGPDKKSAGKPESLKIVSLYSEARTFFQENL